MPLIDLGPAPEAPLPIDPLPEWVSGNIPPWLPKLPPVKRAWTGGARDVAIVGVRDGVARDVVIGEALGLGCIKAIGIRAVACMQIVVQEEDARAIG